MFWKIFTTLLCVAAATALFGWTGRFHKVVGPPMLVLVAVIGWKLMTRNNDEIDDLQGTDEEKPGVGHSLFVGGLQGAMVAGVLALAYTGLSHTPLRAFIEGPDCRAILGQIDILTTGQAHTRIVQVVDTSLQGPLGPVCRQDLRDRKVRALLAMAKDVPDAQRLAILQQAHGVAVDDADLKQLVASRLQAEQERLASAQQAKTDKERIARMGDEIKKLSETNQQLKTQIDDWRKLAEALKRRDFTVEETSEGLKVILSEKDALRFAPDKADLDDNGRATVGRIADLLKQPPYNATTSGSGLSAIPTRQAATTARSPSPEPTASCRRWCNTGCEATVLRPRALALLCPWAIMQRKQGGPKIAEWKSSSSLPHALCPLSLRERARVRVPQGWWSLLRHSQTALTPACLTPCLSRAGERGTTSTVHWERPL